MIHPLLGNLHVDVVTETSVVEETLVVNIRTPNVKDHVSVVQNCEKKVSKFLSENKLFPRSACQLKHFFYGWKTFITKDKNILDIILKGDKIDFLDEPEPKKAFQF